MDLRVVVHGAEAVRTGSVAHVEAALQPASADRGLRSLRDRVADRQDLESKRTGRCRSAFTSSRIPTSRSAAMWPCRAGRSRRSDVSACRPVWRSPGCARWTRCSRAPSRRPSMARRSSPSTSALPVQTLEAAGRKRSQRHRLSGAGGVRTGRRCVLRAAARRGARLGACHRCPGAHPAGGRAGGASRGRAPAHRHRGAWGRGRACCGVSWPAMPISRRWDQPPGGGGHYFEFTLQPRQRPVTPGCASTIWPEIPPMKRVG